MTIFYSPSQAAFFAEGIHPQIPEDAVQITQERHAELLAEQCAGKIIVAGKDGAPIAADPPPPSTEQRLALLRSKRDRLLADSDRTQMLDYPISPEARAAWADYRQKLRDLPKTHADNPAAAQWPSAPEE